MFPSFLFFFLLLALNSICALTERTKGAYHPQGAVCRDHHINITSTASNYPWVAPKWTDNYGLTDFLFYRSLRDGTPLLGSPVGAPVKETATYTIVGTYCAPKEAGKNSNTLFLATSGSGYDRTYWNPAYKAETYNYVQHVINKGYSIFFYDRLGVGASQRVSGFHVQINTQAPILISLAHSLKKGLYSVPNQPRPSKIILIGHSLGSYISNTALAADPTIADAAVLTGYNVAGIDLRLILLGLAPRIARLLDEQKFSSYDIGYLTNIDVFAGINEFFKAPEYERDVASYLESTKVPFAASEYASANPTQLNINAEAFKGPVLVITGEYDHIVCGGYCPGQLELSFNGKFGNLETYVQPLAGHDLNFATNTTGFFGKIDSFLTAHCL